VGCASVCLASCRSCPDPVTQKHRGPHTRPWWLTQPEVGRRLWGGRLHVLVVNSPSPELSNLVYRNKPFYLGMCPLPFVHVGGAFTAHVVLLILLFSKMQVGARVCQQSGSSRPRACSSSCKVPKTAGMRICLRSICRSVRAFASKWEQSGRDLQLLVCNAGIFSLGSKSGMQRVWLCR